MQLWKPIRAEGLSSVSCTKGRLATEEDVQAGTAVFYLKGGGDSGPQPYPMDLPAFALYSDGTCPPIPVVIIQAETADGQVLIGVRPLSGGNKLCLLSDCTLVSLPHPAFPSLDGIDDRL